MKQNHSFIMSNIHKVNNNIYITSDEEIKEGDWVYSKSRNKICKVTGISKWTHKDDYSIDLDNENYFIHHSYCKKIILTTDRDLIGVQAIDDAFLEWFVKNPSCEFVKTDKVDTFKKTNEVYVDEITGGNYYEVNKQYKIIIPKEEPTMIDDWLDEHGDPEIYKKVEKQLELDEAANRVYPDTGYEDEIYGDIGKVFREKWIEGAKYQAERMYSEEEVLNILYKHTEDLLAGKKVTLEEWFEQFKK